MTLHSVDPGHYHEMAAGLVTKKHQLTIKQFTKQRPDEFNSLKNKAEKKNGVNMSLV